MKLTNSHYNDVNVITVQETRIDAATAVQFKDEMRQASNDGPSQVLLNLSNVNFIDSSGLGAIVAAMKLLSPSHTLALAGLTPDVAKVFQLTRMDRIFDIYPDISAMEAKAAG